MVKSKKLRRSQSPLSPRVSPQRAEGREQKIERFDFMFPGWTVADRLDPSKTTLAHLRALGAVMKDDGDNATNSQIPAAYTYFGQFLDHDITLDEGSATMLQLAGEDLKPLPDLSSLRNSRTAATELDSVYFLGVPRRSRMREES